MRRFQLRSRFLTDQAGSSSVEAVLWIPAFILFFGLLIDVSVIFLGQSRVVRVLQDGNRAMSVGRFSSAEETEDYLRKALSALTPNASVETTLDSGFITTNARVPASDLTFLGMFNPLNNVTMTITSQHLSEG